MDWCLNGACVTVIISTTRCGDLRYDLTPCGGK
jgi:hypothetical protein